MDAKSEEIRMGKIVIKFLIKFEKEILKELKEHLKRIFNLPLEIEFQIINLDFAFNPKRKQCLASLILDKLEKLKKNFSDKWLMIVDVDLYSPGLNFIFGEANINSGLSIISVSRLREEFYGLQKNEKLFRERIKKEAVHELGHLYFLNHCQNKKCVMHFSNSLADTDEKEADFCKKCNAKISFLKL